MKSDIVVIGAGASGLMAAYSAGSALVAAGSDAQVTLLEKMPRPARKIMISGKGRCNFTNLKDWNEFNAHIRSKAQVLKPAFYNLPPQRVIDFFEQYGVKTVVERGDRAFPASYKASDIVDALVNACNSKGVKIIPECPVEAVSRIEGAFKIRCADSREFICRKLIIATGGLSYPATGSTGDGYAWAREAGHSCTPLFPSLTALVPAGYKATDGSEALLNGSSRDSRTLQEGSGHIDRNIPLSELGHSLCGIELLNIGASLLIDGNCAQQEFGDVYFTDGGLEGPVGFLLSRTAVKAMTNGSKAAVELDMKPGVELSEITARVKDLWMQIDRDPRSARLHEKQKCRILLGKLMPWELIPAFWQMNPQITTLERRGRADTKFWVNLQKIAQALKCWRIDICGYVGYERAVVTAGGVKTDEILPKTLESRICPGLYFCGEILDIDADTGGYNLQCAFATGALAGESAARALRESLAYAQDLQEKSKCAIFDKNSHSDDSENIQCLLRGVQEPRRVVK